MLLIERQTQSLMMVGRRGWDKKWTITIIKNTVTICYLNNIDNLYEVAVFFMIFFYCWNINKHTTPGTLETSLCINK